MTQENTIAVLGSGTMGGGVAQMFAEHGFNVTLWDVSSEAAEAGLEKIRGRLRKSVEKEKIASERMIEILDNVVATGDLEALKSAEFAVEAVLEDADVKANLYKRLEDVVSDAAVIATNTSSLSVEALATSLRRPERFLGTHFFNPPTKLPLVEIVTTQRLDPKALASATEILTACGKTLVTVKDSPGFIVNRLLLPFINEAAKLIDEGVADAESIDTAMRMGALHPAGPLQVADLIGLDVCESILKELADKLGDDVYVPAKSIAKKVSKGELGRKSGRGFHSS